MKEFYYKLYEESALKLELARIGYEREVKVLATKLLNEDASQHGLIIERLAKIRKVLDEMIETAKGHKAEYHAECEKEVSDDA